MAQRKDTQKKNELGQICEAHTELEEIMSEHRKKPGHSELLTKKLQGVLKQLETENLQKSKEWFEIINKNNPKTGGPTT